MYAFVLISFYANAQADKAKQASNSQSPSQPASTAPVQQHDRAPLQSKDEQHVNADVKVVALPGKDWQDVATFWIGVVLAGVGIAGIGVGICTLIFLRNQTRHIRRQADMAARQARLISTQANQMEKQTEIFRESVAAAQKAADAALKTVQVMIDSERPWLVAHFKGENESCLLESGNMRLKWEVRNVGKSPARLVEAGTRLILDTIGPGWTNPWDYGHVDSLDGRILVPGDSVSFYVFWSKTENGIVRTATGKRREDFNDLVVGYGFVRYRSTVGEGEDLIARVCECAPIDAGVISEPFTVWEFAGEEYLRCT